MAFIAQQTNLSRMPASFAHATQHAIHLIRQPLLSLLFQLWPQHVATVEGISLRLLADANEAVIESEEDRVGSVRVREFSAGA
jgi:hypothetical protein